MCRSTRRRASILERITPSLENSNRLSAADSIEPTAGQRYALVAYMFLVTGTMGFLQSFAPLYVTASGITTERYGLMSAIATAMALLIQPILGRWSDRLDVRRPFMAAAAVLAGVAYFSFQRADSFVVFTLLSALGVNAFQYLNVAPTVIIGRMAQSGGGAAYVKYRVWGSLGYVVVAMGMGWLVNTYLIPRGTNTIARSQLDPLFFYGPILYLLIALLCWFVPDVRSLASRTRADSSEDTSVPALNEAEDADRRERASNLNRFLVTMFFYTLSLYGSSQFLPIFMRELNASPMQITGMFAGGVVCEIVVMLIAGRLSDRIGRRPVLLFALLATPFRLFLYTLAARPEHVMLVQLMHGINFGIVGTIAPVFVNDLADDSSRGTVQAKLSAASGLGLAIGPLLCGFLASRFGMSSMFGAMAVISGIGALWFALAVRESHTDAVGHRTRTNLNR